LVERRCDTDKYYQAIKKTRDGSQRFAIPRPLGKVTYLNNIPATELNKALTTLKALVRKHYPSLSADQAAGAGLDAYVDAGDLGAEPEAYRAQKAEGRAKEAIQSTNHVISGRIAPQVSVRA
jgi:3-dehydroquinate synthase